MSEENGSRYAASETPEERQRRRLIRRWKRRVRAFAPLLGIPLVFGALTLSMDLVRYVPQAQAVKAQASATRPRPVATAENQRLGSARTAPAARAAHTTRRTARKPPVSIDSLDPTSISLDLTAPRSTAIHSTATPGSKQTRR
ncbi:MAG: hypothetical protein AB8G23_12975 [Myxococcota bacterium]